MVAQGLARQGSDCVMRHKVGGRRTAKPAKRMRMELEAERSKRDSMVTREYGATAHYSCGRKMRYESYDDALHQALKRLRKGAMQLRVYECPYCHGWHLTSKPLKDE